MANTDGLTVYGAAAAIATASRTASRCAWASLTEAPIWYANVGGAQVAGRVASVPRLTSAWHSGCTCRMLHARA
jgi:hypothetical protein